MTRYRICAGPTAMHLERDGFRSEAVALTATDGTPEIREKAATLWSGFQRLVAFYAWLRHRLTIAEHRALVARITTRWPGPWFPGPDPDVVSSTPWDPQGQGTRIARLPHGVVGRLLRGDHT